MILAGTAVVYNLTRGEQAVRLPLELLNRAVSITLMSIEHHQNQVQLLKNCFLTLCSDNVLHRAVSPHHEKSEFHFGLPDPLTAQ